MDSDDSDDSGERVEEEEEEESYEDEGLSSFEDDEVDPYEEKPFTRDEEASLKEHLEREGEEAATTEEKLVIGKLLQAQDEDDGVYWSYKMLYQEWQIVRLLP